MPAFPTTQVLLAVVLASTPVVAAAQSSLAETARARGTDITSILHVDGGEPDLATLLNEASVVMRGFVTEAKPRLTNDGRQVETEYKLQVVECLNCTGSAPAAPVSVVRLGGTVQLDGGPRVSTRIVGFPDFETGDDYILFLTPDAGHYRVRHDVHGALRVRDGRAEHVEQSRWLEKLGLGRSVEVRHLSRVIAEFKP